jgi:lipid-A-disaccharide synthase
MPEYGLHQAKIESKKVFFSVGEPSGDLHGANLICQLRGRHPEWQFVGYGGPRMAAAGCRLHADLTRLAVMWISQAVFNLLTFIRLLYRADCYFLAQKPDAVVLIDYPGFNWWIARRAKARHIPVFYYGTPQLWAWAGWRVRKMRRLVDHVLCKLPFEPEWFRQRGCAATYVGHPYFDQLRGQQLDQAFIGQLDRSLGPRVTILPGSRTQEVRANMQTFLRAVRAIRKEVPNTRFAVAAYKPQQKELIHQILSEDSEKEPRDADIDVVAGRTPELIHAADCCMACSGSVSLELLYHTKPSVVLYQVSRIGYFAQWMLRTVRYITLVNLLTAENPFAEKSAGIYDPQDPRDAHVLMPEYLTYRDKSEQIALHIIRWLTDETDRHQHVMRMIELKDQIAIGGASERAAAYISAVLQDDPRAETAGEPRNRRVPKGDAA